jgi:NADPH2:quinone reductase
MKAIQFDHHGGPEILTIREVPKPVCQPEEVSVRVEAIGLNYVDTAIRKGNHLPVQQFPAFMPGEMEGVIEEVGKKVRHLHRGQRVTGYSGAGYAQFAVVPASAVTVLPDDLPLGKGMLIQHLTAQNLLHQATGYQSVLITAAAGGVGSSAVQIAKIKGARMIIGLVGDPGKAGYIQSLGATDVISYSEDNWPKQLEKITEQKGVDLVLESVGGSIGSELVTQLSTNGTMVVYGNSSGEPSPITLQSLIMQTRKIVTARLYSAPVELRNQWTNEIIQWIQSGELNVALTFYSLADAAKAHADLESRKSTGRLILKP